MAPASRALGWQPDVSFRLLLEAEDFAEARFSPVPPFGFFTLVRLSN